MEQIKLTLKNPCIVRLHKENDYNCLSFHDPITEIKYTCGWLNEADEEIAMKEFEKFLKEHKLLQE